MKVFIGTDSSIIENEKGRAVENIEMFQSKKEVEDSEVIIEVDLLKNKIFDASSRVELVKLVDKLFNLIPEVEQRKEHLILHRITFVENILNGTEKLDALVNNIIGLFDGFDENTENKLKELLDKELDGAIVRYNAETESGHVYIGKDFNQLKILNYKI